MLKKLTTVYLGLSLALFVVSLPARADGLRTFSCVGGVGSVSCVSSWREWHNTPQAPTEQELAEIRKREKQWEARCRPQVQQGEFGVRRYVYGAQGCEYGRIN